MAAGAVDDGFLRDPNVRFPQCPRLVPDVDIYQLPYGLGFRFQGGPEAVVVRGHSAAVTIEYLVTSFEKKLKLDEIFEQAPCEMARSSLTKALRLLHTKGLLCDAEESVAQYSQRSRLPSQLAETDRRTLLYWGRKLNVNGYSKFPQDIVYRLRTARIMLIGTGVFGVVTYDLLCREGFENILAFDWDDDNFFCSAVQESAVRPKLFFHQSTTSLSNMEQDISANIADSDLIVCATRNAPVELFRIVNRLSHQYECSVIFSNDDGCVIEIGPLVVPFNSGCLLCMESRRGVVSDVMFEEHLYQQHLSEERPAGSLQPIGESIVGATMAASIVVAEAVRVIGRVAVPGLIDATLTLNPLSGDLKKDFFLRVPRCSECGNATLLKKY